MVEKPVDLAVQEFMDHKFRIIPPRRMTARQSKMQKKLPEDKSVLVAEVAVEGTLYHFDRAFSYAVPAALREKAAPGCRVAVPFGAGNRSRTGMILRVKRAEDGVLPAGVKTLEAVLDPLPRLSPELLRLVEWMQERYFCTLYDAVRLLLPAGLRLQLRRKCRWNAMPSRCRRIA